MKYLICGILGIAIGFFVFYLLFRIANKDKLCKKLQDGSKKKLPKPNFTKLVLVAVLFTYFVGLYIGIKVTLIDYSQFGVLATLSVVGCAVCCCPPADTEPPKIPLTLFLNSCHSVGLLTI